MDMPPLRRRARLGLARLPRCGTSAFGSRYTQVFLSQDRRDMQMKIIMCSRACVLSRFVRCISLGTMASLAACGHSPESSDMPPVIPVPPSVEAPRRPGDAKVTEQLAAARAHVAAERYVEALSVYED